MNTLKTTIGGMDYDTTRSYARTLAIEPGQVYGKLTVVCEGERARSTRGIAIRTAVVLCECGSQKTVRLTSLRAGTTVSCGCYHKSQTSALGKTMKTHGESKTKNYGRWLSMIARCHSENDASYGRYGARGIYVIERWRESYVNFLEDMGEPPSGMTLDRIDSTGPYCKENCRWADYKTQARNTRRNVYINIKGERMLLLDAAEKYGFNALSMQTALRRGSSRLFAKYGVDLT